MQFTGTIFQCITNNIVVFATMESQQNGEENASFPLLGSADITKSLEIVSESSNVTSASKRRSDGGVFTRVWPVKSSRVLSADQLLKRSLEAFEESSSLLDCEKLWINSSSGRTKCLRTPRVDKQESCEDVCRRESDDKIDIQKEFEEPVNSRELPILFNSNKCQKESNKLDELIEKSPNTIAQLQKHPPKLCPGEQQLSKDAYKQLFETKLHSDVEDVPTIRHSQPRLCSGQQQLSKDAYQELFESQTWLTQSSNDNKLAQPLRIQSGNTSTQNDCSFVDKDTVPGTSELDDDVEVCQDDSSSNMSTATNVDDSQALIKPTSNILKRSLKRTAAVGCQTEIDEIKECTPSKNMEQKENRTSEAPPSVFNFDEVLKRKPSARFQDASVMNSNRINRHRNSLPLTVLPLPKKIVSCRSTNSGRCLVCSEYVNN